MKMPNHPRSARSYRVRCAAQVAVVFLGLSCGLGAAETNNDSLNKVMDMSLSELQQVEVTAGTLDQTELRKVPATVTTITSEDIRDSGARNLDELLEIYVPNML